jgi:Fic family protein
MEATFKHYDLQLVVPDFRSPLTDLIIELDYLRRKQLGGSTYPVVFFQLKHIFHTLESIGSARIEGNNTTILEYIENKIAEAPASNQGIREIENMEKVMSFIDENVENATVSRAFVSELHKNVVEGLQPPPDGEGDHTPGLYRTKSVSINRSAHKPPEPIQVEGYMDELFAFINRQDEPKYDLLKVAIAHHRFLWIHPFTNGNGRTVRLLTYAMLVKEGFNVDVGRIQRWPGKTGQGHKW